MTEHDDELKLFVIHLSEKEGNQNLHKNNAKW